MNPEARLEHKVMSLVDRDLAKEIIDKLDWYRLELYKSRKEVTDLRKRLSDISWSSNTQMGRY